MLYQVPIGWGSAVLKNTAKPFFMYDHYLCAGKIKRGVLTTKPAVYCCTIVLRYRHHCQQQQQ